MKTIFQQLGPYEIIQAIGHGMAGAVFLARDTRTQQRVALKLVPHGSDHDALEILAAERWGAELQKQLSHVTPHVPTVFEHGDHESGYYVAMEYLDGENLSTLISRGKLSADQAAGIAIELCRFLEAAHSFETVIGDREFRSVVHGDLTPRNVRITSSGKVKVLDFGIAKALSLSRKVTRNDFGTLWYLSPERLESGVVDEYVDFWAIGVMLFEMVGASRPFQAEDTRRLERLIVSRRGAPPLQGCPAGLQSVIAKLLAPTPAERYASAQSIREDLESFRSGRRTQAEQEGWPDRTSDEAQTRRTQPAIDTDDAEKTRRTVKSGERKPRPKVRGLPGLNLIPVKVRRLTALAVVLIVVAIVCNDIWISVNADDVAAWAATRELDQMGEVWDRYDDLAGRDYFQLSTLSLEHFLTQRSMELADRVIANYRTSLPTVREAQWKSARDVLARAAAAAPDNRQIRAALRYCEGHLHRINGEAKRARRQFAEAQKDLSDAVAAFREAAELRPGWPDPFLGLGRTFIYGLQDLDRGADALRQAEKNGYAPGERETVQLADGYRLRGDTLVRNAKQLSDMPQERDYLERAAEAYRQALTLYLSLNDFSTLGSSIRQTQQALNRVEKRLADFSDPAAQPVPPNPVPEPAP
jgi:tetratricopeptide (TPR) repeat protein